MNIVSKPRIIYLQPEAPRKPATGAPCNGCGLCCLLEPCPVGILVSRRLRGTCKALLWAPNLGRYRCGIASAPGRFMPLTGPRMEAWVARWVRRMISADSACDADVQAQALTGSDFKHPDGDV